MTAIRLVASILSVLALSLVVSSVEAKDPPLATSQDNQSMAMPTRESLEKRIYELIDAAVRKDEKQIASMVLGGKGERHSWNRQVIWEYMYSKYSRECKNITIYIVGYTAYTRFWCLPKQLTGMCPERNGGGRFWVFRGGQWYLAEPPFRNEDPTLQKEWLRFIEEHKNKECSSEDDAQVISKTKEFVDLLMQANLNDAKEMVSRWCGRNSFDRSFDLDATRIDTLCSLYECDYLGSFTPASYEIDPVVDHKILPFSQEEPGDTCFFLVTVHLHRKSEERTLPSWLRESKLTLAWLKEGNEWKLWERW